MKKLIKIGSLMLLASLANLKSNAQIKVGAQQSTLLLSGGPYIGLGLEGDYVASDKLSYSVGFNYYLPKTTSSKVTAMSNNSSNNSYVDITRNNKNKIMQFTFEGKYCLKGDFEDDFSFYALGGISVFAIKYESTYDYGTYNENDYSLAFTGGDDTGLDVPYTINFGVGVEYMVGPGYLFGNARINFPPSGLNSKTGVSAYELPPSLGIHLGYKIVFGY